MNKNYSNNFSDHFVIFKYLDKGYATPNEYWFKVWAKNKNHAIAIFGFMMGENMSLELNNLLDVLDVVDIFQINSEDYNHVIAW